MKINNIDIKIGTKIYFLKEKRPYVVKALNERFIICTKPFNLQKTVYYTIIDINENIRGTNNLVFNLYDYKDINDINECLKDLESGETQISHRNRVELDIINIKQ